MRAYPAEYEFVEAADLSNALAVLSSGEMWRPIAGGTDVMVLFNSGFLAHRRLISIRKIPELTRISILKEAILIGASVTYAAIQQNKTIQEEFPLLCRAANWTGSVANQNRGTLGGNIANGSPAADSPPALLVYDAELELVSARGIRQVPYCDFHTGYKKMNLEGDELILAVRLPRTGVKIHQYARKVGSRKAQAISKVSFHATAQMESAFIRDMRLALGSVAPVPVRCRQLEQLLIGQQLTPALIQAAREKLADEIQPIDDIRSTATYRSQVSQNLLTDFLEELL